MLVPVSSLLDSLEEATSRYQQAVSQGPALRYLVEERGLSRATVHAFRLGVVADPAEGHGNYRGRLSIPYLTPAGVSTMRFRCIQGHSCREANCPKYLGLPDHEPRLYNTRSLFTESTVLGVTEGEIDCITVEQSLGIPCIGYQGVSSWQGYFNRALKGYERVLVFADGDKPGREAAQNVALEIGGVVIELPDGHDVNSVCATPEGVRGLKERSKIE